MRPNNFNLCDCGHDKFEHVINTKFQTGACSHNQKTCDCWEYKARRLERNDHLIKWGTNHGAETVH
jgi:hypothetical protein